MARPGFSSFMLAVYSGVREERPSREILKECFADRYWHGLSLVEAVRRGLELSKQRAEKAPFVWLTQYNAGASRVALAALTLRGITHDELQNGFLCDPDSAPEECPTLLCMNRFLIFVCTLADIYWVSFLLFYVLTT